MLYMAAPIASSAIKTPRTNVIGLGLKMNPKIDREFFETERRSGRPLGKNGQGGICPMGGK